MASTTMSALVVCKRCGASGDEIATIVNWVDGAQKGNPQTCRLLVSFRTDKWSIGTGSRGAVGQDVACPPVTGYMDRYSRRFAHDRVVM
jgi:hypothetical protein